MRYALLAVMATVVLFGSTKTTLSGQDNVDCPILEDFRESVGLRDPSLLVIEDIGTVYTISMIHFEGKPVFNLGIVHTNTGSKIAPETVFVEHTGDCRIDYVDGNYGSYEASNADQREFTRKLRLLQALSPKI